MPNGGTEIAVTCCSMAEMYDHVDAEDARIAPALERAWEALDDPALPRDAYYAFMASKCLPVFDRLGFFLYAHELKERIDELHART